MVDGSGHLLDDRRYREGLNSMRLSGEMCDVTLIIEGQRIRAHKLVLASCSPYFRGMFRTGSNFNEKLKEEIKIDPQGDLNIKFEAVHQLVNYMYSGKVEISHFNAIDLIRAADLLELSEIKNETLSIIAENINWETYLYIREVGTVFSCPRLLEAVDGFIRSHFQKFISTEAFLSLEPSDLIRYLKNDHLRTDTEEDIFQAILTYCKMRNEFESSFIPLCNHVKFDFISIKYLLGILKNQQDLRNNEELTNFLLDKMQRLHLPSLTSRPRFSTQILVAMPYKNKTFYHITFYGDHIEFVVKEFPECIGGNMNNYSICKISDNLLYFAGGICTNANDQEDNPEIIHSDKSYVYNILENSWALSAPLSGCYNNFGLASINNKIYVLAGSGPAYSTSDEVEFMELGPDSDREWYHGSSMNYNRNCVSTAVVNDKLYAIGGTLDGGYTSLVELYDEDGTWIEVDPMSQARCQPGIAVANGKIYVVGGLGDNLLGPPGALKTVEYYDPQMDSWTSLPDMYFSRQSPAVAFVNNKLFVFGGGSPSPLARPGPEKTIECFDFERHEWFVLQAKIPGKANSVYVSVFLSNLQ